MSDETRALLQHSSPAGSSHDLSPVHTQDQSEALIASDGASTNASGRQALKDLGDGPDLSNLELEHDQVAELAEQVAARKNMSAFRKPRAWWYVLFSAPSLPVTRSQIFELSSRYILGIFCLATAASAEIAPTIDLFTQVICEDYKQRLGLDPGQIVCSTDPRVRAQSSSCRSLVETQCVGSEKCDQNYGR